MRRRWRARERRGALSPGLEHFLATGCYSSGDGDLEAFQLAGRVMRGDVEDVRALWSEHQAVIAAATPRGCRPWAARFVESGGRQHAPSREYPALVELVCPPKACAAHAAERAERCPRRGQEGDR